jgi:hypothetical protein
MIANEHLGVAVCVDVSVSEDVSEKDYCSEPQAAAEPAAFTLPLNTGAEYPIPQAMVLELSGLYQSADVMAELRKMKGWLMANPAKRKTKTGVLRFITNWLAREHDAARTKPHGATHGTHRPSLVERVRANAEAGERADRARQSNGHSYPVGEDDRDLRTSLVGDFRRIDGRE